MCCCLVHPTHSECSFPSKRERTAAFPRSIREGLRAPHIHMCMCIPPLAWSPLSLSLSRSRQTESLTAHLRRAAGEARSPAKQASVLGIPCVSGCAGWMHFYAQERARARASVTTRQSLRLGYEGRASWPIKAESRVAQAEAAGMMNEVFAFFPVFTSHFLLRRPLWAAHF